MDVPLQITFFVVEIPITNQSQMAGFAIKCPQEVVEINGDSVTGDESQPRNHTESQVLHEPPREGGNCEVAKKMS